MYPGRRNGRANSARPGSWQPPERGAHDLVIVGEHDVETDALGNRSNRAKSGGDNPQSRLRQRSAISRFLRSRRIRKSLNNRRFFEQSAYKDFPFLQARGSSIHSTPIVMRDTIGIERRDRLHTYKRPCWALSLPCPGPDSNRAAGLHPDCGEYTSCSA